MATCLFLLRRAILSGPILAILLFPLLEFLSHRSTAADWNNGLVGVPKTEAKDRVDLTESNWSKGIFQRQFSAWFESNCPGREFYLRLFNQINYSVFRASYMLDRKLVVGPHGQLDNIDLITDAVHQSEPSAANGDYMKKLREIQFQLQQRGKKLLVVTTPSKAMIYPETIPHRFQGYDQHQPLFHNELLEFLDQTKIPYVDGSAILERFVATSPFPLFEQGGLHWNTYAAAQVVGPLLEKISQITGQPVPRPAQINGVYEPAATSRDSPDTDLAELLNVLWPPLNYKVAHAAVTFQAKPPGEPPRIVMAGDSFGEQLVEVLNQAAPQDLPAVPRTQYDMYFIGRSTDNRISREVYKELLAKSDVVVIEVNQLPSHQRIGDIATLIDESTKPEKLFPLGVDVSFAKKGSSANYTVEGFKNEEDDGRWTNQAKATLWMTLPPTLATYHFSAEISPYLSGPQGHQRVEVGFNGQRIAQSDFRNGQSQRLEATFSASGQVELEFFMPDFISRPPTGQNPDENPVGIKFHSMRLKLVLPSH